MPVWLILEGCCEIAAARLLTQTCMAGQPCFSAFALSSLHAVSPPFPASLLAPPAAAVVFKCVKADDEPDTADLAVVEAAAAPPAPWVPCESFNATECEEHKECALCEVNTPKRKEKGKPAKEM